MEYGALVAEVGADAAASTSLARGGYCPSPLTKEVAWTYAVNDADIQQLAEGEEVVQTYRVIIRDAAGAEDLQLVTIRLQGSNDEPIAAAVALVVDADAELSVRAARQHLSLQAAFVADDVDSDDDQGTLTYELLGQPSGGTVTNNNDGTFSFDPGHDFDDLAEGETRDVTVTYRAIDSHGAASNEATITITVRGVGSGGSSEPPVVEDQSLPLPRRVWRERRSAQCSPPMPTARLCLTPSSTVTISVCLRSTPPPAPSAWLRASTIPRSAAMPCASRSAMATTPRRPR